MTYNFNVVVIDTETGGLQAKKNPLIEIACCPFNEKLEDLPEYTSIIAPYDDTLEYTEGALKANGITMEQIYDGRDSKEVIKELSEYLKKLKKGRNLPVLCCHNLKFDIFFLETFFVFHKKNIWDFINKEFTIDTLWWSRVKFLESVNYRLGTCCDNVGIELIGAHRAVNDTRATKELAKSFIKYLREEGTGKQVKEKRFRETFQF